MMWGVPVEETGDERWVRIWGPSGVSVTLGGDPGPVHEEYDFVDLPVSVAGQGLGATTLVRTMEGSTGRGLIALFQALADDWRGDKKEVTWTAIEHGLRVDAKRDSVGHVFLTFELRENYQQDAWAARVVVSVEAGEEMSRLAGAVRRVLAVL
jgi:hypothetical protein